MPAVDPKSPIAILGAAATALLVLMFLPWYGLDIGGELGAAAHLQNVDTTANAWQAFSYTDLLLFLTAVAGIGAFALHSQGNPQAATAVRVAAGLGALCTLIVIYRILNQPGPNNLIQVKVGAFLGLIAVAGITFGAWRTISDGPTGTR